MNESPRKFHIVHSNEEDAPQEPVVDSAYIGGKLEQFAPQDFRGSESAMIHGYIVGEDPEAQHRRLNIRFYNPYTQAGPFRTVAEFSYRNLSVPEQDVDKIFLRYSGGKFRLQRLERVTQTRKFIFTDCGAEALNRVSEWLDNYSVDEKLRPI